MRSFFLFLALGLWVTGMAQNRGTLVVGGSLYPVDMQLLGVRMAYYRPVAGQLLGLKGGISTDAMKFEADEEVAKLVVSHIDLVCRWSLKSCPKSRIWLDLGLSGLQVSDILPPELPIAWCGTGLTDEEMERMVPDPNPNWQVERTYFGGMALALHFELALGKRIFLGFELPANTYYSGADKRAYPFINPGVNLSFPFR